MLRWGFDPPTVHQVPKHVIMSSTIVICGVLISALETLISASKQSLVAVCMYSILYAGTNWTKNSINKCNLDC